MYIIIHKTNNGLNEEQKRVFDEKLLLKGDIRLNDNFALADPSHKLILRPDAVREIFDFVEWDVGQRLDVRDEQGGILIGKRFLDEGRGIHYVVVTKSISADGAHGSMGSLEITNQCWGLMHDKKDDYNREIDQKAIIVGWFHTHPNQLGCFMSSVDRYTQDLFFDGDNTYSIVINPQRHLLKAYRAKTCLDAQAFLLLDCPHGTEN
ncbi:MAG: hypothetical protein LBF58_10015 [Deltaproteobacteria bacterium]|nr:hypothetical protein [Deltaproteobacteria bacterium]